MSQPLRFSHLVKPKIGPEDPELVETLREGLEQVSPDDVTAIAQELVARRRRLAGLVEAVAGGRELDTSSDCAELARALTATQRQASMLCGWVVTTPVRVALPSLFWEEEPVEMRLDRFLADCGRVDRRLALEFATGLLHLRVPARYWLWTRWLWDIEHGTGILPLLASSTHALEAPGIGARYRQLRPLVAMGAELGQDSGLLRPALLDDPEIGPFAVDAFLAAAYSVYLYGITNWRLSREFNRLLPSLPDLARRLLGLPPTRRRLAA